MQVYVFELQRIDIQYCKVKLKNEIELDIICIHK